MENKKQLTYKAAGVDIDLADEFIERIKPSTGSTRTVYSMDSIGAFAGMLDISRGNWKSPLMVACTDGVGTKLKLAFETGYHNGVGIDLVAMSINDLLVTGAEPLAFLDYLATSKLDLDMHTSVVEGIAEGCRQSGCVLLGGETAELPGFYQGDEYDLAGFAIGLVEKDKMYTPNDVQAGDWIIGLISSGIHSNGFSLVRKVFEDRKVYPLDAPLTGMKQSLGELLLTPTRIYSREMAVCRNIGGLKSAAHITGGGIPGNLPRALPGQLGASLFTGSWPIPEIFNRMQQIGNISGTEMYRTFNMGLGMMLIVAKETARDLMCALTGNGFESYHVGEVSAQPGVTWTDMNQRFNGKDVSSETGKKKVSSYDVHIKKVRIAIVGSGRGSNMASICDAIDRQDLDVEIGCVISNNSKAFILESARNRGIPAIHISGKTHPESEMQALLDTLKTYDVDAVVLAGYMKKLAPEILQWFRGKVFNIHPALLPSFGGTGMFGSRVHEAVLKSGAKYSGVTVHLVDEDYDRGRILAQRVVSVLETDTGQDLADRILLEEHDIYWRVLRNYLCGQ
ncbi:phosphoribosylformylglycinamidine cyclo-ligase [bacterium]|nr:phosphoribosylformylglycinamidine cyclo-ligase [bacterium]